MQRQQQQQYQIVTVVQPDDIANTSDVQHVADYQRGWNDAQQNRPHEFRASIYYSTGFVDGAATIGGVQ